MEFKKALVIGSGVMGPGIALGFALGGVSTTVTDVDKDALHRGKKTIEEALALFVSQKMMEKDTVGDILGKIQFSSDLAPAAENADLVIEAVSENPAVKESIYRELDDVLPPDVIIGSNTSSLPIPEMYPDIRPGRLIIIHYFNPPHIMPLVEIVRAKTTPDDAIERLRGFYRRVGKYVVVLNKFLPGFLINRIQVAVMREVLFLLGEGLADPDEIDTAFKCCSALRGVVHGPFEHMDMIGLDTVESASRVVFPLLANNTDVPKVISDLVGEGRIGYKGSGGFYPYPDETKDEHRLRRDRALLEELKLFRALNASGDIMIKE
jgi:3-hydroxybutyryl-CoA dehydrogenase